jgi:biotin-dependent carboxylase-like uncharacterized protein
MTVALRVLSSVFTTVQDSGRPTMRRYGVPLSGAMDAFALEVANRIVGNPPTAAALEITAGGTAFEVLVPTLLAITGSDLGAQLDGQPLSPWTAVFARAGSQLLLAGRQAAWGARAYLALAGGVKVPEILGSRSTCLPGGFGGFDGRLLRTGDQLSVGSVAGDLGRLVGRRWPGHAHPAYQAQPTLRVLPGSHTDIFASDALETLQAQSFRIAATSNRMGYRLEDSQLRYAKSSSIPSLGVVPGVIQVPPDGAPILLMADAQPTGGYPIIGVIIEADLPLAAQLLPGDSLSFALVTMDEALSAYRELKTWREAVPIEDEVLHISAWAGAIE